MALSKINSNMIDLDLRNGYYAAPVVVDYAATVNLDFTKGNIFTISQTGNLVIDNPELNSMFFGYLYITVDATGGYTLGFGSDWDLRSGSYVSSANTVNIVRFMTFPGQTKIHYFINQRP